jgi:hypothetical protein
MPGSSDSRITHQIAHAGAASREIIRIQRAEDPSSGIIATGPPFSEKRPSHATVEILRSTTRSPSVPDLLP